MIKLIIRKGVVYSMSCIGIVNITPIVIKEYNLFFGLAFFLVSMICVLVDFLKLKV